MSTLNILRCAGFTQKSLVRRFHEDNRGNFSILFGLTIFALIVIVGMGIDYLTGLSFKTRWDTSADAAAIAAVKAGEAYLKANAATETGSTLTSGAIAAGIAAGTKAFNANAGVSEISESVTPSISVTITGTKVTANVTYSGSVQAHFGPLVGVSKLSVSGNAAATGGVATYVNFYIIVDVSQSMGIGSTQTDMDNLYARTASYGNVSDGENGCVFGCHVPAINNNGSTQTYSNEFLAHDISPSINLRIDAAKAAIGDVITQAENISGSNGNIKIGLYEMSNNAASSPTQGPYLTTISSPTSNFNALTSAVGNIDLGNSGVAGFGDTDYNTSLGDFTNSILNYASSGNGLSQNSPINYVILITDGVKDIYCGSSASGHCTSPIDTSLCTAMQAKATVGVIYTTYLPVYKNNDKSQGYDSSYASLVLPITSQIGPNLQSCASASNLYFQADDGPALISAMQTLFASTLQQISLTQ